MSGWTHTQGYLAKKQQIHYLNDFSMKLTKAQTTEIVLFKINTGQLNTRK